MRRLLILFLALAPSCAMADMTATYGAPKQNFTMKIEIAANGDVRGDVLGRPDLYIITRDGHGYFIQSDPSGPIVTRTEDMGAAMAEQLAKLDPGFRDAVKDAPVMHFVEKGEVTVNGRKGTAYFLQWGPGGELSPQPWAVISHDPSLAPLGKAMARQLDLSTAMMGSTMPTNPFKEMQAILMTGTVISYGPGQLQTIAFDPIPATEFELPGPPESLDHLRARLDRQWVESERKLREALKMDPPAPEPAKAPSHH